MCQWTLKIIAGRASEGVTLTTVGFGMGNYQDETMEQLADKGNGNNFYIDTLEAATKVFHKDLVATLEVVAKDVKLQVDFDPAMVTRYRLVGYENREIADKDVATTRSMPARSVQGSKNWSLKSIRDLASANAGIDVERLGFVKLVDRAIALRAAS